MAKTARRVLKARTTGQVQETRHPNAGANDERSPDLVALYLATHLDLKARDAQSKDRAAHYRRLAREIRAGHPYKARTSDAGTITVILTDHWAHRDQDN